MNDSVGAQPSGGADGFDDMDSGAAPAGADLDGEGITDDGMQDDEIDASAASDPQADGSSAEQSDDGSSMLAPNGLDRLLLSFTSNCWIPSPMPPGAPPPGRAIRWRIPDAGW